MIETGIYVEKVRTCQLCVPNLEEEELLSRPTALPLLLVSIDFPTDLTDRQNPTFWHSFSLGPSGGLLLNK